jgi:hypothetical protein
MEPQIVQLAGDLRPEQAVPNLMALLDEGQESVIDEIGAALGKIGTDAVVEAVSEAWWEYEDWEARSILIEAVESIHADLSVKKSLEFLRFEEDVETQQSLGRCLLSQFASEAIEPAREMVLGEDDDLEVDQWELRWMLMATCRQGAEQADEGEEAETDTAEGAEGEQVYAGVIGWPDPAGIGKIHRENAVLGLQDGIRISPDRYCRVSGMVRWLWRRSQECLRRPC